MFLRVWLCLFIVFIAYTLYLYAYCDNSKCIPLSLSATKGREHWQNRNCQGCHQLYGLGGYMGPDLTNIISTKGEKSASVFIKYGTGNMPNMHLSDTEVKDLIAYLAWVDRSGKSNVPASKVHWTGTYIIDKE